MKRQNKETHHGISPRRTCNPFYTMKMSSRYRRLLIYDVKSTSKIDGMGPFNIETSVKSTSQPWLGPGLRPVNVMFYFENIK